MVLNLALNHRAKGERSTNYTVVMEITFGLMKMGEDYWVGGSEGMSIREPRQLVKRGYQIIVPTDFSAGSTTALAFAASIARPGDKLTSVHAIDPLAYQFGSHESSNSRRQVEWSAAQLQMAQWLQLNKCGRRVETALIEGEPAQAVAEFVKEKGGNLLVIATSGRQHAGRLLLGSVAEEIFRMSNCPVMVLGPKARVRKTQKITRLVFATDLEPHSLAVFSKVLSIAQRLRVGVLVLRVVDSPAKSRIERDKIRSAMKVELEVSASPKLLKHLHEIHVTFAPPLKGIISYSSRTKASAIVMGIRSGGELTRAATHIPWTFVHRVIAEATCPVITIRG